MGEFWFESDGVRVFGREEGEGPTIVMLHGALATHLAARPFVGPSEAGYICGVARA